ncbi:hypothetical protein OH407_24480, partial [Salmonella enterica]|uniref:hypothetical protein n=1 Tax=Salmonella enterica TaxID=28901 RepID=UPI0022B71FD6
GADAFVAVCSGMTSSEVARLLEQLKTSFAETTLETHGVKALVDVEINFLTLSGEDLRCTAVQAVDRILSLS